MQFGNFNRKINKPNAHTRTRFGLFGIRKKTPKSQLMERRVKINTKRPASIAQNLIALAVATTISANLDKVFRTADSLTTARFCARVFSKCARGPGVSVATPRILADAVWDALMRFCTTRCLPRWARGLAHKGAKMYTASKRERPLRRGVLKGVGWIYIYIYIYQ